MLQTPTPIAILAIEDATASVLFGLHDLFLSAGRDWGMVTEGRPGPQLLAPRLVARQAKTLRVYHGVHVEPHASFEQLTSAPVVCIPDINVGPNEPLATKYAAEVAWLRTCYAQGATLATSCSGTLLLAEAGLLDGCEATTHWAFCDVLQQRFPRVIVRSQRSLVVSGPEHRLIMAGGGTSYLDLGLFLIARLLGVEVAMQVARVNLIDWHEIGQQPFARLAPSRQREDAVIERCQLWIAEHYDTQNPVSEMLRQSGLPERTFKRRFQLATGMSPLSYVHTIRLEEAKQLLETSTKSVDTIAHEAGYGDPAFFGRLFRRHVNLTPAQYRKRFGGLRKTLAASKPKHTRS